jgi:hypothetical protein
MDFVNDFKFAEKSFLPKELLEFLGRRMDHQTTKMEEKARLLKET